MSVAIAEMNTLIHRQNHAVARSAGMVLTGDGMVTAHRPRPALAFMFCILGAIAILTFCKAVLLASMGPEAYGAALTLMQDGGVVDRIGALFLGIDCATATLGAMMS